MPTALRWLLNLAPTNPIVVRLVQNGSRRTRHMYIRTGYLAALIIVLLWALLINSPGGALSYRQLAATGAASFMHIAYFQLGLICVLTPVFMAGAIAQEADPKTWNILLTTPLSSLQIVLGSLLGRLFFVLALLVASLPLFAITQFYGGVPARSIFLTYAVSGATALAVGAIAVALSVFRMAGRRAVFTFYIAVVSYIAVTAALDGFFRPANGGVTWLTPLNPFLATMSLLSPSSYPTPAPAELAAMGPLSRLWFGSPVLSGALLSVGLSFGLVFAGAYAVRAIGEVERGSSTKKLSSLLKSLGQGRTARTVWHNPVAWREASMRAGVGVRRLLRWVFIAAGVLWGLALIAYYHGGGLTHSQFRFAILSTVWAEFAVIALIAINMSASAVSREREDGSLDILLTTPITPVAYLGGKLRGLIAALSPMLLVPVLTLAFVSLYVLLGGLGRTGGVMVTAVGVAGATKNVAVILPEASVVFALSSVPFVAFCAMVGLQWSIKRKGAISSVVCTVAVVGVVGGIIGLCGSSAAPSIPVIGPALATLNPLTAIHTAVYPEDAASETFWSAGGRASLRWALLFGAAASALGYALVVYLMRAGMVRSFDMTVRRLAGQR